ncbi:MAG: hypothetical protein HZA92_16295 [Verrucomicrobia bacterium]|nr:hypothetical protein [Verrucomicrobiota bacterium]
MKTLFALFASMALATFTGCKPSGSSSHSHSHGGGHHHEPPHGGTAIDLGEEEAHLEFVLDATAGRLTCYVLKAHMAGFQRVTQESLELAATVGGKVETLTLKAVANAATGEKAGDTSQFEAQADWLKTAKSFDVELKSINVRGKDYTALKFNFPKGGAPEVVKK